MRQPDNYHTNVQFESDKSSSADILILGPCRQTLSLRFHLLWRHMAAPRIHGRMGVFKYMIKLKPGPNNSLVWFSLVWFPGPFTIIWKKPIPGPNPKPNLIAVSHAFLTNHGKKTKNTGVLFQLLSRAYLCIDFQLETPSASL